MVNSNNTICCLNPYCKNSENSDGVEFCSNCGTAIIILRNRYRPIKLLSDEGGFGRTYLAQDLDKLKEICVIKQLAPQQQGTAALDKAKELFEGEAKQLQQLGEHPQIPRLLAYFEEKGYLYSVQQYIRGKTLDKLPKQGCWNEQEVKDFLNGILPVLEVIHHHKVIHRDIKPANIIRQDSDGKYVLIDFGASKEFRSTVAIKGTTIGTWGYSPIEQLQQGEAYPASDLFSIGVTCFYLLTKVNPNELYVNEGYGWLKSWQSYLKQPLSEQFKKVLDKLLQKDRRERYQSATEVLKELNYSPPPTVAIPLPTKSKILPTNRKLRQSIKPQFNIKKIVVNIIKTIAVNGIIILVGLAGTQTYNYLRFGLFPSNPLLVITGWPALDKTFTGHIDSVNSIAFSPDDKYLASGSTGKFLASGSWDDVIKIWDVATGKEISTLKSNSGSVMSVAFSPDGKYLASGSTGTYVSNEDHNYYIEDRIDRNTIKIWDVVTGKKLKTLSHLGSVNSVAFSPDGKYLASGSIGKYVSSEGINYINEDHIMKIWNVADVATVKELKTFNNSENITSVAFSPDGKYLASGSENSTIKIWNVATVTIAKEVKDLRDDHSEKVTSIIFSPDGKYLASGSEDDNIIIWNIEIQRKFKTLRDHFYDSYKINSIAFSPDGKYLASGSSNKIKIWDVATGRLLNTLSGHSEAVNSVAFSPDGKYLASGSADKTIKIWRMK